MTTDWFSFQLLGVYWDENKDLTTIYLGEFTQLIEINTHAPGKILIKILSR